VKQIPAALQNTLYSGSYWSAADVYTFYFPGGTQYLTTADQNVTSGSTTWTTGSFLERGKLKVSAGMTVDTMDLTMDRMTVGGMDISLASVRGLLDSVRVVVQRSYSTGSAYDTSAGLVTVFDGIIAEVQPGSALVQVQVKSLLTKAEASLPFRVVQPSCPWQVYDANCGISSASFTDSRTAASGSTAGVIILSSTSTRAVPGSWVTFTSGSLVNQTRLIRTVAGVTATLDMSFATAPAVGDPLTVKRGCDKSRATCTGTFNNYVNNGGLPWAPNPEITL
jgi:uncharacterized phage protein (TIGR02218 family)